MYVGDQKIEMENVKLLPSRVIIKVNDKPIPLNKDNITQVNGTDNVILLIAYPKPDGSVVVTFPLEKLTVLFNGHQVLLKAGNRYRSSVRGVCGTLDGEWLTDFTTKDNCIVGDPRHFVASYVDDVGSCKDKDVLEAIEEAKHALCFPKRVIKNTLLGRNSRIEYSQSLKESVRQGESSESSDSSDSSSSSDSSESTDNSENSSSSDSSSSNEEGSQEKSSKPDSNSSSSSSSNDGSSESNAENGSSSSSSSSEEQKQNKQEQNKPGLPKPDQRQEDRKRLFPQIFWGKPSH